MREDCEFGRGESGKDIDDEVNKRNEVKCFMFSERR
jgi:hypothetical protein